jgi:hypothetical protein
LLLSVIAYNLGSLLRRLVLPLAIQSWSRTSVQQRLFPKTTNSRGSHGLVEPPQPRAVKWHRDARKAGPSPAPTNSGAGAAHYGGAGVGSSALAAMSSASTSLDASSYKRGSRPRRVPPKHETSRSEAPLSQTPMTTTTTLRISVFDLPDLARHKTGGPIRAGHRVDPVAHAQRGSWATQRGTSMSGSDGRPTVAGSRARGLISSCDGGRPWLGATCKRELKDDAQRFCNECSRGFGKKPARAVSDPIAAPQPKRE